MANIKITELDEITTIDNADVLPIVDLSANETKKVTKESLVNDVYSTSEVKTNKVWIDGKPIYRKTIYVNGFEATNYDSTYNALYAGVKTIETGITNLDFMVNMYGNYWDQQGFDETGYKGMFPLNFSYSASLTSIPTGVNDRRVSVYDIYSARAWVTYFSGDDYNGHYNTIKILSFVTSHPELMRGYITLEYTKTS